MNPVTSGPSNTSKPAWAMVWAICAVVSMVQALANKSSATTKRDQHEGDVAVDPPRAVHADAVRARGDPALEARVEHSLGQVDHLACVADASDIVGRRPGLFHDRAAWPVDSRENQAQRFGERGCGVVEAAGGLSFRRSTWAQAGALLCEAIRARSRLAQQARQAALRPP
jgi:hypothetical protein